METSHQLVVEKTLNKFQWEEKTPIGKTARSQAHVGTEKPNLRAGLWSGYQTGVHRAERHKQKPLSQPDFPIRLSSTATHNTVLFTGVKLSAKVPCLMYHLWLLYLGNKLWSLIGQEPIMWRASKTHATWLDGAGNMQSDFQRFVRNNRGFEGIVSQSSAY